MIPNTHQLLWSYRSGLAQRRRFGLPMVERGLPWWQWRELYPDKLRTELSITFSFVATHNHFVLDRGGKVFNRSAPVVKLAEGASVEDHLGLLGPLNSSAGCFWMKQVFHNKGGGGVNEGFRGDDWEFFFEHDATKLARFPLPPDPPVGLARALDDAAHGLSAVLPARVLAEHPPSRELLDAARMRWLGLRARMVALQEELDWECYRLYGLIDEDLTVPLGEVPEVELGERAFEIVLARRMAAGETVTTWFERHNFRPLTEIPSRWPDEYQAVVERRIEAIEQFKTIRLIERPEYKRRWQTQGWEAMERAALRSWLLDRLETGVAWPEVKLATAGQISDRMLTDPDFQTAVALYAGEDKDPVRVVAELLGEESVPYLAVLRYTTTGMETRAVWERTWELQRAEDKIDARTQLPEDDPDHLTAERAARRKAEEVGPIDVPPKYKQADFRSGSYWRQRGKLDVPKERFTSYPDAAADGSTLYGWAGWDHAQRAQALAQRIVEAQESDGLEPERLTPLLAGLYELLPWLHQWRADIDPAYGMPLSDFYDTFLDERARTIDTTRNHLHNWQPHEPARKRREKATS